MNKLIKEDANFDDLSLNILISHSFSLHLVFLNVLLMRRKNHIYSPLILQYNHVYSELQLVRVLPLTDMLSHVIHQSHHW